jgi:type I restriction enzyme, S subunit
MTNRKVRVGDVVSLVRKAVSIDPEQFYMPIGIRSFGKGLILYPPTSGTKLSKLRYFELPPDALVLSNIKAWEGAVATTTAHDSGRIASNRFLSYVPTDLGAADVRYLHYFFLSEAGRPLIEGISPGAADRNRTLGLQAFENLVIPMPEIVEQKRIVSWLDHIHERRREASRRAEFAATATKALHDALCGTDGPLIRIGDKVSLVRNPVHVDQLKEYAQIGIYSFGKGIIYRQPVPGARLSKLRYFEIPPGALLLSNIQAWEGAIAFSREREGEYIASNRFLSYVSVSDDVDTNYLRYFFLSARGQPLIQRASPGTVMRNRTLGIQAFENLKIPLPELVEQRRIAEILDKAYDVLRHIDEREKMLDALLASALNQAFSSQA